MPEETKLMILSPVVVNRKGEQAELFVELRAKGFVRVRVDGKVYEIDATPHLTKNQKHTIEVVVDRLRVRQDLKQRLAESFETALRHGDGRAIAVEMDSGEEHLYSAKFACPICSYSLQELEPRLFSFNNPMGACPRCDGLGSISFFDPKRVVAFPQLSLASGAIKGWDRRNQFYFQMLQSLAKHYGFDLEKPFNKLPERIQQMILYGSEKEKIAFQYLSDRGKTVMREHAFEGIIPNLERRYRETDSIMVREELAKYLNSKPCPECDGTRLRREARHVKVGPAGNERAIFEVSSWPLKQTGEFFRGLKLEGQRQAIADKIVKEIVSRLQFLNNVGLDYLSLDRSAETLSGGEAQRIRLASQIGSGLTGVMYVLDEPSIGLHQRDNDRLLTTLKHLRDLGNSVIVVEHDQDAILSADHVVDMGPGAGEHGGHIVAQGTPDDIRSAGTFADRTISCRAARDSDSGASAQGRPQADADHHRRDRQQPEGSHAQAAGGTVRLRDRRFRFGQVDADQRHAVPRGGAPPVRQQRRAGAVRRNGRPRALRQGDQRRPEPDRPHAALESGDLHRIVHADSRAVRAGEGSARARLRAGPVFVQRQGRPLRSLPGRRPDQGRDALPARRLRAVRRLPRPALQPRDAGDPVQGPQHPRRAVDDRRAGARVLRAGAGGRAQAAHAARRGSGLHHARAVGDHAVRRRGAAGQARAASCPSATPAARCTSSTSRPRACTSTTSSCC